jgi:hypothetical protein
MRSACSWFIGSLTALVLGAYAAFTSLTSPAGAPVSEATFLHAESRPEPLPAVQAEAGRSPLLAEDRNRQTSPLSDLTARVTSLEVTLATLEQQLRTLTATVAKLPTWTALAGIATGADSGLLLEEESVLPSPEILEKQQAEQQAAWQQHQELLERSFWSEPVDGLWSDQAFHRLQQVLSDGSGDTETTLLSMECRSTLCRIELLQPEDPQVLDKVSQQLLGQVGQALPHLTLDTIDHHNGEVTTVIYLARDGYALP